MEVIQSAKVFNLYKFEVEKTKLNKPNCNNIQVQRNIIMYIIYFLKTFRVK